MWDKWAKRRDKTEVLDELKRLRDCAGSDEHKYLCKINRERCGEILKALLTSDMSKDDRLTSIDKAKAYYEMVTEVLGQEFMLVEELQRIEKEEELQMRAVSQLREKRMGGAV